MKLNSRCARAVGVGLCGLGTTLTATAGTAAAAPTESSATETIDRLRSEGYRVIVSKVGNGPLTDCTVNSIRRGHSVLGAQSPTAAAGVTMFNPGQVLQYTTMYVGVECGH